MGAKESFAVDDLEAVDVIIGGRSCVYSYSKLFVGDSNGLRIYKIIVAMETVKMMSA